MFAFLQGRVFLSAVIAASLLNLILVLTRNKKKNKKVDWSKIVVHEIALFFIFFVILTFVIEPADNTEVFIDDPEF